MPDEVIDNGLSLEKVHPSKFENEEMLWFRKQ